MYQPCKVHTPDQIDQLRTLLYDYGAKRNFDKALGNYQEELASLPGKYGAPDGCALIVCHQEEAVACIAYRKLDATYCEMKRLYVLDTHRGQGLARQLVHQLLEEAKTAGYHYMRLDTHPSMLAAQGLYQSIGFSEIERYNENPTPGIRFFEKALD